MAGMRKWCRVYRRVLQVLVGFVFVLAPLSNVTKIIRAFVVGQPLYATAMMLGNTVLLLIGVLLIQFGTGFRPKWLGWPRYLLHLALNCPQSRAATSPV